MIEAIPCPPVEHSVETLRSWAEWGREHPWWHAPVKAAGNCVKAGAVALPLAVPGATPVPPAQPVKPARPIPTEPGNTGSELQPFAPFLPGGTVVNPIIVAAVPALTPDFAAMQRLLAPASPMVVALPPTEPEPTPRPVKPQGPMIYIVPNGFDAIPWLLGEGSPQTANDTDRTPVPEPGSLWLLLPVTVAVPLARMIGLSRWLKSTSTSS